VEAKPGLLHTNFKIKNNRKLVCVQNVWLREEGDNVGSG
jgi:hypothetical protein